MLKALVEQMQGRRTREYFANETLIQYLMRSDQVPEPGHLGIDSGCSKILNDLYWAKVEIARKRAVHHKRLTFLQGAKGFLKDLENPESPGMSRADLLNQVAEEEKGLKEESDDLSLKMTSYDMVLWEIERSGRRPWDLNGFDGLKTSQPPELSEDDFQRGVQAVVIQKKLITERTVSMNAVPKFKRLKIG